MGHFGPQGQQKENFMCSKLVNTRLRSKTFFPVFPIFWIFQKLAKNSVLGPPGGPEKLATRVFMMETRIPQISAPNSPGNGVS